MGSHLPLNEIASEFAGISGVESVAWCGSTAMQKADSLSDYDLYVYWRRPVPLDVRKKIIASRASEYQLDNSFWELDDEWIGGRKRLVIVIEPPIAFLPSLGSLTLKLLAKIFANERMRVQIPRIIGIFSGEKFSSS